MNTNEHVDRIFRSMLILLSDDDRSDYKMYTYIRIGKKETQKSNMFDNYRSMIVLVW